MNETRKDFRSVLNLDGIREHVPYNFSLKFPSQSKFYV